MKFGGIVLCGGRSSRMGLPKATLPFGPEQMLQRVVRLLGEAVSPIVVVASPSQELPNVSDDVIIARDEREDRGPLQGLAAGLAAIKQRADAAYVTSCDVPLLVPEFVSRMGDLLAEHDLVVPKENQYHHPLAAVYRTSLLPQIQDLLAANRMRLIFLFENSDTLEVPVEQLRAIDPELATLANLNSPSDYTAALRQANFQPDPEILAQLKSGD